MAFGIRQNGTAQLTADLLPASDTILGGVKIGANITALPDGTISVPAHVISVNGAPMPNLTFPRIDQDAKPA